jgi:hypothetical protein
MASVGCDSRMGKHVGRVADTWENMWVPCTRLLCPVLSCAVLCCSVLCCALLCCPLLSCHFVSFPVPFIPTFSRPTMSRLRIYLLLLPFGLTNIPCYRCGCDLRSLEHHILSVNCIQNLSQILWLSRVPWSIHTPHHTATLQHITHYPTPHHSLPHTATHHPYPTLQHTGPTLPELS